MKMPGFTLRGFKPLRETLDLALGNLERELMELLWHRDQISVRDAQIALHDRVAYTTAMTTLDRLHKKGLLNRRKEGRAFLYSARVSRSEFDEVLARELIENLLGTNAEPILACLVQAVSDRDRRLLDQLDELIKEKRREMEREDSK